MIAVAYTDGSYKDVEGIGGIYSGACLLQSDQSDGHTLLSKADNQEEYLPLRNIAGEISAVMMACEHCMNVLHMKHGDVLLIKHDYVGLDYWCRPKGSENYWRAKTPLTIMYRDYMNTRVKTTFEVRFEHVEGHSGNVVNDAVDQAAKKAIDEFIEGKRKLQGHSIV